MENEVYAEQALLGGLMIDARGIGEVAEHVAPADFAEPGHGDLFGAMLALSERGIVPEPEALLQELNGRGDQQMVADLFRGAVSAANAIHYADLIRSAAQRRRLRGFGQRLAANDEADYAAALSELEAMANEATLHIERPPPRAELIPTADEILNAKLAPRCIVERYLFADVATLIAPGGTGKTTLLLLEAALIALGRPVHGLRVESPGWTLIVSAEDARPRLLARLTQIVRALELNEADAAVVFERVLFWDVAGRDLRLIRVNDGNIALTQLADDIVRRYRDDPPAVVVFDPLISFGASEQSVNDNEQGLITAARRIIKGLECCVRLVHHTGKAGARAIEPDQYSGRGGSALADGARMVAVLQRWNDDQPAASSIYPPPLCHPSKDASIVILHRLKMSYSPPDLPRIWIKRTGFAFESFIEPPPPSKEQMADAQADQLERFIISELKAGRRWQKTQLEACRDLNLKRDAIRSALTRLMVAGRIIQAELPRGERKGARQRYLSPPNSAELLGGIDVDQAA